MVVDASVLFFVASQLSWLKGDDVPLVESELLSKRDASEIA